MPWPSILRHRPRSTPAPLEASSKSTNGGGNWTATSTGLTNTAIASIAIDPSAPGTLYVGTIGGGVFRSTNGGGTWTAFSAGLLNPTVNALAIDPVTPGRFHAGTGGGVFDFEVFSRLIPTPGGERKPRPVPERR
jgi:hypothetical protein